MMAVGDTQPFKTNASSPHAAPTRRQKCPTCGEDVTFFFLGVQEWPAAVAERMNMPTTVYLWQCGHCSTTITREK